MKEIIGRDLGLAEPSERRLTAVPSAVPEAEVS